MKQYNNIVVGSGISGLTLALLLAMNGRSVLLIEKNQHIGGSIARFRRQGVPFDIGFHFTGALNKEGTLHDMLSVLDIHEFIEPVYFKKEGSNTFIFQAEDAVYEMPMGYEASIAKMKAYFPSEAGAIDCFFSMVKDVCSQTVSMDLRKISLSPHILEEDHVSLSDVLNRLTQNQLLQGLLAGFSMCYGVKPAEISFADHSRVCFGLYESMARIKDGGDAIIAAFKNRFSAHDIDIMTNSYISECIDIKDSMVGRFVLNSGEEIACDHCIFTIHPKEILKTLPREHFRKAFIDRVNGFEPAVGFFFLFGLVKPDGSSNHLTDDFGPSIVSLFPTADLNQVIDPRYTGDQAMVIMRSTEASAVTPHRVLNAIEVSFPEHVAAWRDSTTGNRPEEYYKYKQQRTDSIRKRIIGVYPEYRDALKVVDAASILTFRDYLHTPDGSAYGIKQKMWQYNLFGKLPLRNVYAAGQSAVLPGILGAMMSAFIVARALIGKEDYTRFIERRL